MSAQSADYDAPAANGHTWPCPGFYAGNHHPHRDGKWSCACPIPPVVGES